jgi:hypothetical protein
LDLINKPQLWSAHPEEEQPLYHVLIWVGEEHYPQVVDFIEEARRFGISRRIRANFPFEKLTAGKSQMVLLHPKAINLNWEQQTPPDYCPKSNPAHLQIHQSPSFDPHYYRVTVIAPGTEMEEERGLEVATSIGVRPQEGPCLGKIYNLLPVPAGQEPGEIAFREMPSFRYSYTPSGESVAGLTPGIFGIFPLTGVALIKREDGTVNEEAEGRIQKAGLNYYHAEA